MSRFDRHHVLHELKHYLPAQAPLKDFVHHNTLHAFQKDSFFTGLKKANELFGYKTTLPLREYRERWDQGSISQGAMDFVLRRFAEPERTKWEQKMRYAEFAEAHNERIGQLRATWKRQRPQAKAAVTIAQSQANGQTKQLSVTRKTDCESR